MAISTASLPTRERELKPDPDRTGDDRHQSLPTRERELKRAAAPMPRASASRSLHGSVN